MPGSISAPSSPSCKVVRTFDGGAKHDGLRAECSIRQARRLCPSPERLLRQPTLVEQKRLDSFTAPFTVLRLLTLMNMAYEAAKKKRAEPYNKIVAELPEMRRVPWT